MKVCSFNIKALFASVYFCVIIYPAIAQTDVKPLIWVEQMEYVYDPQIESQSMYGTNRVILPTDTIIAEQMKQSVLKAIAGRWNGEIQNAHWDLNRLSSWKNVPRFKPRLNTDQPGGWQLFFQVFDNGPYPINRKNSFFNTPTTPQSFESLDTMPYNLQVKAALLNGANGAIAFSQEMNVEMKRTTLIDGQMLLRKVPGSTASFIKAFDSAVGVFFGNTPVSLLKLPLVPVFVFFKDDSLMEKTIPLNFKVTGDTLVEEPTLQEQWTVQKLTTKKLGKKNKLGNNLLGTTFTLITGVGTERVDAWKYLATIEFKDVNDNKQYTCNVPYNIEERQDRTREKTFNPDGSKSYGTDLTGQATNRKFVDPNNNAYFMEGTDTVGYFHIKFGEAKDFIDQFTQCWDGKDSASIINMPEYWNNNNAAAEMGVLPVFLEGSLYNHPFMIQNSRAGNQLDLMADGQLIATLDINYERPSRGFLFSQPGDSRLLKAMLMLSSLPFGYFH